MIDERLNWNDIMYGYVEKTPEQKQHEADFIMLQLQMYQKMAELKHLQESRERRFNCIAFGCIFSLLSLCIWGLL